MTTKAVVTPATKTVTQGESVTLTASVPNLDVKQWQWLALAPGKDWVTIGGVDATTSPLAPDAVGVWTYRATPLDSGGARMADVEAGNAEVTVTSAGTQVPNGGPTATTVPLKFPTGFALVSVVVLLALLGVFVAQGNLWRLPVTLGEAAQKTDPRAALAASVIGPMLAVGTLVLLAGLWMVLTEWRAAFKPVATGEVTTRGGGFDSVTDMLKAVATLKGSTLVFVGGLAVLFAVAWMVSSAAGVGTSAATTPSSAPSSVAATTASAAPSAVRT